MPQKSTQSKEKPYVLKKYTICFLILSAVLLVVFVTLHRSHLETLVRIDRPLPQIGDSVELTVKMNEPPLKTAEGSRKFAANIQGWMEPDNLRVSADLTFEEYAALCTPELLAQTQIDQGLYDQFLQARKARRQKGQRPHVSDLSYFVTARSNGTEFVAVCNTRGTGAEDSNGGNKSFQFYKKSGDRWQYDVPSYPANPFSVLPYDDLDEINEMIASGKAKVNEAGKLKPIDKM